MNDERYMELALRQAGEAKQNGEWPFGAVVVQGDTVVAQNRCRETSEKTVLAHAEMHAINDACISLGRTNLSDCVIYCTNEPCLMCASAIFQAKIPRVVIGACRTDLPHLLRPRQLRIEDLAVDAGFKTELVRGVLKEKVIALFEGLKRQQNVGSVR